MTTMPMPSNHLRLTTAGAQDEVRIEIDGDLDFDNAGLLQDEATRLLTGRPGVKHLRLHCAGLGTIDSTGLSVLLMIHRRTTAAGVGLHLEDRPANLERLLDITGTLDLLTAPPPTGTPQASAYEENVATARPAGPESSL
ncbi:STAS domain-containing protein [Streptomyces sp. NPDC059224]|uniref:STAS domain-containing protein n=1 Tax=Streptomyces sp. NPDC059224 TaxID=3346775 RepID=UPI003693FB86